MASLNPVNLRPRLRIKDPHYPLNVPVKVLFAQCSTHRNGIISKVLIPGSNEYSYHFIQTGGRSNTRHPRPLNSGSCIEVLVDNEQWDCWERM